MVVSYLIAYLLTYLVVYLFTYLFTVVFKVFDKDNDGLISLEEWIRGMSIYLRGTKEEQIKCKDMLNII